MNKKFLTIILSFILAADVFGAYVAPAKETVVIVGGLGDQSSKSTNNGGGATKAAWDGGSPSDFIHTNGAPFDTCSGGTISDNGSSKVRITSAGDFDDAATVGVLVNCVSFSAVYDDGRYEVIAIDASDNYIDIELAYSAPGNGEPTVDCYVGGAIDGIQNALDKAVNNPASYNRYIYDNIATETVTATIDADTYTGAVNSHLIVVGYNSTLAAETEIIITTTTDLDPDGDALLLMDAGVDYTEWWNIDFDGGGKDASRALYGVQFVTGSNVHVFRDCKFHAAENDGASGGGTNSDYLVFTGCEFYLNGRYGWYSSRWCTFIGCSFHDNDQHGVYSTKPVYIFGCLSYDNGKDSAVGDGFYFGTTADKSILIGNTSHGNYGDGFHIDDIAEDCVILNNTSVGNGDYGYDLQSKSIEPTVFFGYNHAYDNDQNAGIAAGGDYCSETASEALFQVFRHGSNQTGDPKFTSVVDGSEDFTPASGSDLIDNALDAGVK